MGRKMLNGDNVLGTLETILCGLGGNAGQVERWRRKKVCLGTRDGHLFPNSVTGPL